MNEGSSDLERLRAAPIPRDPALCSEFAARFEPPSLRVVFALLWLLPSAVVFAGIPALAAGATVQLLTGRPREGSTLLLIVMAIVWLATFAASWIPFARFIRRRAAELTSLFRDGQLVDARATGESTMSSRAGVVHVLSFTFEDAERLRAVQMNVARGVHPDGQSLLVLCRAGVKRVAIFPAGNMIAKRTR